MLGPRWDAVCQGFARRSLMALTSALYALTDLGAFQGRLTDVVEAIPKARPPCGQPPAAVLGQQHSPQAAHSAETPVTLGGHLRR
jgi:hypothetical protein